MSEKFLEFELLDPSFNRGHLITELPNESSYSLDKLSTPELLNIFSDEDLKPQLAVKKAIPELAEAIDEITKRLSSLGRLFYIGAGTSGRLGVLDAAECPPTFCTSPELVQAVIAGGYNSLVNSSEGLEDSVELSIEDLKKRGFNSKDCLVGITAGGTTPYVTSALEYAHSINALTVAISSVPKNQTSLSCDIDIRLITGPEILTGSTRLKSGTATKMALNIISTCVMIKLGKVFENMMIDVSATNNKLLDRAIRIISDLAKVDRDQSLKYLKQSRGSVKLALLLAFSNLEVSRAELLLKENKNNLRRSLNALI